MMNYNHGEIVLADWKGAGLKAESIIRWKVFTVEAAFVQGRRGSLSNADKTAVQNGLNDILKF